MKLSVSMTAYNREKFIVQAIESVLMQEVNFDYEIVIGEDCSTDKTRDIILSYQEKYPDKINLLLNKKNLGLNKNFVSIIQSCKGEYIALIDDDDYWTSPKKLQKQVDFLDANPECTVCFHDSRHFYEDGMGEDYFIYLPSNKEVFTIEDLAPGPFIPTSSTMFRQGTFGKFPDWFSEMNGHDWPLHLLNAQYGNMGYINEIMSATRNHQGGDWNGRSTIEQFKRAIHDCEILKKNIPFLGKNKLVQANLAKLYFQLATEYEKNSTLEKAREYMIKSILECPLNPSISKKLWLKLFMKLYVPLFTVWA